MLCKPKLLLQGIIPRPRAKSQVVRTQQGCRIKISVQVPDIQLDSRLFCACQSLSDPAGATNHADIPQTLLAVSTQNSSPNFRQVLCGGIISLKMLRIWVVREKHRESACCLMTKVTWSGEQCPRERPAQGESSNGWRGLRRSQKGRTMFQE